MKKQLINAENAIFGRMISRIAKKLMLGYKIDVVNIEKSVILGRKDDIIEKYKKRTERGHPYSGPFFPKTPHAMAKRAVKGMLPKGPRGKKILTNIKFHIGNPTQDKGEKLKCDVSESNYWRYIQLGELSVILGAQKRW